MSFIEDCRRIIGFDSSPAQGNRTTAEFVANLCRDAGLHVEFQSESLGGIEQCNVIARPQPEIPPQEILFQCHLDTVDPGSFTQWTKTQANPFSASIYEDVIYGLGTADVKLDFLCKLEALKTLVGKKMRTPFVLAGTYGAHNGMAGAIKLIRRKKMNAIKAFIGAPTDMRLAVAGKGIAVVDIVIPFSEEERKYRANHDLQESSSTQSRMFAGKAADSFNPLVSDNAIMKMLEYLSQLPDGVAIMDLDGGINYNSIPATAILEIDTVAGFKDPILPKMSQIRIALLELEEKLREFRDDKYVPPYPTMNVGMIRSFDSVVQIIGSCRLPPTTSDEMYQSWMRSLHDVCEKVGATFRVREYRKGFETDTSGVFVKNAQEILDELGHKSEPVKMTMSTEASVFGRLGVECLVWGPGLAVGNSHGPNEHVRISDLKQATEFYKRAAERFCL